MKDFVTIDIKQIEEHLKIAMEQKKYVFIGDMSGKLATFFSYNQGTFDLHAEVKKCIIHKKQSKEDVQEIFRSQLVRAIKYNRNEDLSWIINFDTMCPALKKDYDSKTLPLKDMIFNR